MEGGGQKRDEVGGEGGREGRRGVNSGSFIAGGRHYEAPTIKRRTSFPGLSKGDWETKGYDQAGSPGTCGQEQLPKALS